MSLRKHIPNTITSLNLVSGFIGVIAAFYGRNDIAFLMMLLAAVFDFCDGLSARMLGAYSEMGKELDSLCDAVSFGVLPAIMLFKISTELGGGNCCFIVRNITLWSLFPILIAVFSAVRLAKFNIDERQSENFIGLATPACAMICGSLVYYVTKTPDSFLRAWCAGPVFIPVLSVVLSALLVSEFPMFSMKFKKGEKSYSTVHKMRIAFIGVILVTFVAVMLMGLNWSMTVFFAFVVYIVMNILQDLFGRK